METIDDKLIIDESYLSTLHSQKEALERTRDLVAGRSFVELHPPKNPLTYPYYKLVRQQVFVGAVEFGYTVLLSNQRDVDIMLAILGPQHVAGDFNTGFKYRKSA